MPGYPNVQRLIPSRASIRTAGLKLLILFGCAACGYIPSYRGAMMATHDMAAMRSQLVDIDAEIGELRAQVEELREIGGDGEGAMELEDRAAATTRAQELEAIIGELMARRDDIAEQLGMT